MARFGDRPVLEITTREVAEYLRALDRSGTQPRSVNKHRQVLAAMFAYGSRTDTHALPFNPVTGTDKRRENPPAAAQPSTFAGKDFGAAGRAIASPSSSAKAKFGSGT